MKKKELKKIAYRIATNEKILQTSQDNYEIKNAREEIMRLSNMVYSLEDMMLIDDLVQDFLKNS